MLEAVVVHAGYGSGESAVKALDGVSCRIERGSVLVLVGANGSGKTTLGRLLCGMELASGGRIVADGHDPALGAEERLQVRSLVGFCQQNPVDQIVSSTVYDEVAFGPRNLGLDEDAVGERVASALERCGLIGYERRATTELSGGEQQRLALAGVLAMRPRYLVLDEPTSQLDATARTEFRALVRALAADEDVGVVLITHDPLEVLEADDVLVLEEGREAWEGPPCEFLLGREDLWCAVMPHDAYVDALRKALMSGYAAIEPDVGLPEPEALAAWLVEHGRSASDGRRPDGTPSAHSNLGACSGLCLDNVSFSYGDRPALQRVDLTSMHGRVLLLSGCSGSGKSTLVRVAAGLYEPDEGQVALDGAAVHAGSVGLSFQNPEQQFFLDSVHDEIAFAPRNLGCPEDEVERRVLHATQLVGLDVSLLARDPFALSGGQARLAAIASVLSLETGVYLLDEPTAGLDAGGRQAVHQLVLGLAWEGAVVLVVSHDVGEWLDVADDAILMRDGSIVWSGLTAELQSDTVPFEMSGLDAPLGVRLRKALAGMSAVREASVR